jgi:Flp pilus assembly protein TadD
MTTEARSNHRLTAARLALAAAIAALVALPASSHAGNLFSHVLPQARGASNPVDAKPSPLAAQVRQALDERRYVDAGALLQQALTQNGKSAEISTLTGDLLLARGRYADALEEFRQVASDQTQRPQALEGEGLALSLLGRSDEALADLKQATVLDKDLWRAWDGLGTEYDQRRDWPAAQSAYAKALATPGANAAIVLNNRGYSRLLQQRFDEAAADFVAALEKDPSLGAARTNLRLTLAMEGHYARAALTGDGDDRAAVLNNVGVAAALRGDYVQADKLLGEAIETKGQFYSRASENLQLSHTLAARRDETANNIDVPPP